MKKLVFALLAFMVVGCAARSDDELVRQIMQMEPPWLDEFRAMSETVNEFGPLVPPGDAETSVYVHCIERCSYVQIVSRAQGLSVFHGVGGVPGVPPQRMTRTVATSAGRGSDTPVVLVFHYLSQNLERAFEACASSDRCYLRNEDFPDAGLPEAPFEVLLTSRAGTNSSREVCLATVTFWDTRASFTLWRSEPFCRPL